MTQPKQSFLEKNLGVLLGVAAVLLLIALMFARFVYPESLPITLGVLIPLVVVLGLLIRRNHQILRSRTTAYGLNSLVTILLVLGLLGVANFMASRYPQKLDLTRNKTNTLSDQTSKLIKGLKQPVKVTLFAKLQQREQFRPLLENYKALSPKFEIEYVDPDREPARAKAAGIKKYGTLLVSTGGRDTQIDDFNEEKLTNALIKLTKEKSTMLCSMIGHGEKSFASTAADGYDAVRKGLQNQSYEVKEVSLVQEGGKIPAICDAIVILGPTKAYFDAEVKTIREYLENGGRGIVALDVNVQGAPFAPELLPVLASWNVKPVDAMIVDPVSRLFQVDASMPVVADFSRSHPITRDFQMQTPAMFPISRPLDIVANTAGLTTEVLGKTTAQSWAVTDFKMIASGQVQFNPAKDRKGPFNEAVSVEGKQKDSKATRNTRLVVFGSSNFASNQFSRFGANLDFFLNAASWVMEDESMISIRTKDEDPGKIEMSAKAAQVIQLVTIFVVPLLTALMGVVIWVYRRRL